MASKCLDLHVVRPTVQQISRRLISIAHNEGLALDAPTAERLVEQSGHDLRQVVNAMQFMHAGADRGTTGGWAAKDSQVMLTPFEVARIVLTAVESRHMSIADRLDGFFVDYDMLPLLMQENYVIATERGAEAALEKFKRVAIASEDFVFSDQLNVKIRKENSWSLLVDMGVFCLLDPAYQCKGYLGRANFPSWFGRNSAQTKSKRLLNELQLRLNTACSSSICAPTTLKTSGYIDALSRHLVEPLRAADGGGDVAKECAQTTIRRLEEYSLEREHLVEHIPRFTLKAESRPYEALKPAVKSAFTRTYTAVKQKQRAPGGANKGKGRSRDKQDSAADAMNAAEEGADAEDAGPLRDEAEMESGNEGDSADEVDSLLKQKQTKGGRGSKASKTPTSTRGASSSSRGRRGGKAKTA